ncbi:hypothetical protein BGY98DRAFT_974721 [Russula aff. rugulosa BPL654]|nr:hypothetical protein BGY98DRAFT_974721 [Russula aff. rugulosa BPL654]
MPDDEFTLRMSFLMGFFVILSLFISWYFRRDPIVRPLSGIQEGLFKVANFRRWIVLVVGSELVIQPEYTLDLLNMNDLYHADVIRSELTRNIAATFNEVREEIIMTMGDLIPTHEDGKWQSPTTVQRVICRATNRIFVRVPLCGNHDYQTLNLTFAVNTSQAYCVIHAVEPSLPDSTGN